ncbi:MAG: PAS domain S-box protein [Anaerolineae bacterium]
MPNLSFRQIFGTIVSWWQRLTLPPAAVTNKELRRNIAALSGLMLGLWLLICTLGLTVGIAAYIDKGQVTSIFAPLFAGVCFFATYLLSRQGHVHYAATLGVITSSIIIFANVIANSYGVARSTFYYLSVPLVFCTVFLPPRYTIVTAVLHILGIFAAWVLGVPFAENSLVDIAGFYVIFSGTVTLITVYSKRLETQRLEELKESRTRFDVLLESANEAVTQIDVDQCLVYINPPFAEMLGYRSDELLGHHYTEFVHPDSLDEAKQAFNEWLQGARGRRDMRFLHKNGTTMWMLASSAGTFSHEGILLMLTDITDRKLAEAADHEARQLAETFNEVSVMLNSTLELDELLNRIVSIVVKMIPHDACEIFLVSGDYVEIVRHRNYLDPRQDEAMEGVRLRLTDVRNLADLYHRTSKVTFANVNEYQGWVRLPNHEWVSSFCSAPICIDEQVIGFITLTSQMPDFFNNNYTGRLIAFANYAAVAIQNAQLFEQADELAVTRERQRLARELHDAVTQTLFATSIMAETLPRLWDTDPALVRERLGDLERLTRGALAEMRTSIFEMRPETLTETDFSRLLGTLADTILSKSAIEVALHADSGMSLLPNVQLVFYRVAQEALNNVIKHSGATQLNIYYTNDTERAVLTIRDNGMGFNPAQVESGHFGLKIMRERAESVGAVLEVTTHQDTGTHIRLTWEKTEVSARELISSVNNRFSN